jgi:hypothetical protein
MPCAIRHRTLSSQASYNASADTPFFVTVFNADPAGVAPSGSSYIGGAYRIIENGVTVLSFVLTARPTQPVVVTMYVVCVWAGGGWWFCLGGGWGVGGWERSSEL